MPSGRPTTNPLLVNFRRSQVNVKTVASFSIKDKHLMHDYIERMNDLKIGHFYIAQAATAGWDEEELLYTLMQPIDEATTASLSAVERESCSAPKSTEQHRSTREELGERVPIN